MLREDAFDVELLNDGATAIGRLCRPPVPDAIVTELLLPNVDGGVVMRFARSFLPGLPVFVTTRHRELVVASGRHLDPPPVVHPKPIDYASLRDALLALMQASCPTG